MKWTWQRTGDANYLTRTGYVPFTFIKTELTNAKDTIRLYSCFSGENHPQIRKEGGGNKYLFKGYPLFSKHKLQVRSQEGVSADKIFLAMPTSLQPHPFWINSTHEKI